MNDVVPTGSTEAPPGLGLKQYLDGLAQYLRGERARFARWVIAGIVRVDTRYSGVWYLTLVDAEQSDAGHGDKVTASAAVRRVPGTGLADPLIFDAEQGPLRVGQKVLVKVAPGLSRAGRLSLDILDIDTTYTLGELTVREIETRRRLQADGLYAANRTLPAPRTIQRIAVIAPQASQGFEDFRTSLAECEAFGFVQIVAVDAVFQGERAKASIPAAFATVGAQGPFDIVFLVRGGGDARDLAVLSEYEVAAAVCACPFPVWTGIGHEQDNVVAQEVAQRAFGTPSKAAEALANRYAAGGKRLVNALEALAQHGARLAAAEAQHLRASQRRLRQRGADLADRDRQHLATLAGRIGRAGEGIAAREHLRLAEQRRHQHLRVAEVAERDAQRLAGALRRISARGLELAAASQGTLYSTSARIMAALRGHEYQAELRAQAERARQERNRLLWVAGIAIVIALAIAIFVWGQ